MSPTSISQLCWLYILLCCTGVLTTFTNSTWGNIKWTNCTFSSSPQLSCATLAVPIDWDKPQGGQVDIFITRLSASNQKNRIGNLFFNLGGPGLPVSTFLMELAELGLSLFPPQFDIIGPDPRGTGRSHPLSCDPTIWNERVSFQPTTEAQFQALVQKNQNLGASCLNLTGPLVEHMDSASVAKDFEAIRLAMGGGEDFAYASMFPDNLRAMALDGNLDHSLSETSMLADEVYSYEDEFVRFSQWCNTTKSCSLYGKDIPTMFTNLTAHADIDPIPASEVPQSGQVCRQNVTGQEIRFNFQPLLISKNDSLLAPTGWFGAADALKAALDGNATALCTPIAQSAQDTVISSNGIGTLCQDWNRTNVGLSGMIYKEQMTTDIAPNTQGASASFYLQAACINWPGTTQYVPRPVYITGTPPILLTNAYHDPETPYVEANGLLNQFANAVLATRLGDGHTSYYLQGETYRAINEYLVTVQPPPPNTLFSS